MSERFPNTQPDPGVQYPGLGAHDYGLDPGQPQVPPDNPSYYDLFSPQHLEELPTDLMTTPQGQQGQYPSGHEGTDAQEEQKMREYDALFLPVPPEEHLTELTATHEDQRDPRLELLFAPRTAKHETPEPTHIPDMGYDHLFERDPEKAAELSRQYSEAELARREYFKQFPEITDEMKKAAWTKLWEARQDPVVVAIMSKCQVQIGAQGDDPYAIVDTVRNNADLRYELGSYYLRDKLPAIQDRLPYRVAVNTQKNPNHPGYRHIPVLTSQEYSAMLALSMIDGTYAQPARGDEISLGASGAVELGQHRAAAQQLISERIYTQ